MRLLHYRAALLATCICVLAIPDVVAQTGVPLQSQSEIDPHVVYSRTECFGICPAFRIEIDGSGFVKFEGSSGVAFPGNHTARLPASEIRQLADLIRLPDFFIVANTNRLIDGRQPPAVAPPGRAKSATGLSETPKSSQLPSTRVVDGSEYPIPDASIPDLPTIFISYASAGHFGSASGAILHGNHVREFLALLDSIAAEWVTGNSRTVSDLLAEGVNLNAPDSFGWTPLMRACEFGSSEVIADLLRAGASASVNAAPPGSDGQTPMMFAARRGNLKMVTALLNAGGDPSAKDASGKSVLDYARASANDAVVQTILSALSSPSSAPPR